MKISENALGMMSGARGCDVPHRASHGGVNC